MVCFGDFCGCGYFYYLGNMGVEASGFSVFMYGFGRGVDADSEPCFAYSLALRQSFFVSRRESGY